MTESSDKPEYSGPPQPQPPAGGYPPPPPSGGGYPPPPPQPYSDYSPQPAAPRNGLGTTGLVLGIVGILTSWTVIGGIALGIAGVVVGILGRKRVARGEADNGGIALAGIVLSAVSIVLSIVLLIVFIYAGAWFWNEVGGDAYIDCMNDAGSDQTAQQQCEQSFSSNVEDRFSTSVAP